MPDTYAVAVPIEVEPSVAALDDHEACVAKGRLTGRARCPRLRLDRIAPAISRAKAGAQAGRSMDAVTRAARSGGDALRRRARDMPLTFAVRRCADPVADRTLGPAVGRGAARTASGGGGIRAVVGTASSAPGACVFGTVPRTAGTGPPRPAGCG